MKKLGIIALTICISVNTPHAVDMQREELAMQYAIPLWTYCWQSGCVGAIAAMVTGVAQYAAVRTMKSPPSILRKVHPSVICGLICTVGSFVTMCYRAQQERRAAADRAAEEARIAAEEAPIAAADVRIAAEEAPIAAAKERFVAQVMTGLQVIDISPEDMRRLRDALLQGMPDDGHQPLAAQQEIKAILWSALIPQLDYQQWEIPSFETPTAKEIARQQVEKMMAYFATSNRIVFPKISSIISPWKQKLNDGIAKRDRITRDVQTLLAQVGKIKQITQLVAAFQEDGPQRLQDALMGVKTALTMVLTEAQTEVEQKRQQGTIAYNAAANMLSNAYRGITTLENGSQEITSSLVEGVSNACMHAQPYSIMFEDGFNAQDEKKYPSLFCQGGFRQFCKCIRVTFHNGLREVPDFCFAQSDIENIILPSSVEKIGRCAFIECHSLHSINLENVKDIGMGAFARCHGQQHVDISLAHAQIIGRRAFESCDWLENVTFGEQVQSIGQQCFLGCMNMTTVRFPGSVAEIGPNAFSGSEIKRFLVDGNVGILYDSAFAGCKLEEVVIRGGVTTISQQAFERCCQLKTVRIGGNTVPAEEIARQIVGRGIQIKISLPSKKAHTVWARVDRVSGNDIFFKVEGCAKGPISVSGMICCAGNYIDFKTQTVLAADGVALIRGEVNKTAVGEYAFSGCDSLQDVRISSDVIVGSHAFLRCCNLKCFKVNGEAAIENNALNGCSSLTEFGVTKRIKGIGAGAFAGTAPINWDLSRCDGVLLPSEEDVMDEEEDVVNGEEDAGNEEDDSNKYNLEDEDDATAFLTTIFSAPDQYDLVLDSRALVVVPALSSVSSIDKLSAGTTVILPNRHVYCLLTNQTQHQPKKITQKPSYQIPCS